MQFAKATRPLVLVLSRKLSTEFWIHKIQFSAVNVRKARDTNWAGDFDPLLFSGPAILRLFNTRRIKRAISASHAFGYDAESSNLKANQMILEQMTTNEVESAVKYCQTVLVPFGVLEAHGPHMPLATDTIQAYDAAKRTAKQIDVFVAAPIHYGMCRSASGHPGTIGISGDTLRSLTFDIVSGLYKSGMRNFILYSGHASSKQIAAMQEGSEKFIDTVADVNIAVVSDYDITKHADFIETPGDIHAGEIETSRIMFIEPSLVRLDKFPSAEKRQAPNPILIRDHRRYWPGTVEGDPTTSSAEKGEKLCDLVTEHLVQLVRRMHKFDPH